MELTRVEKATGIAFAVLLFLITLSSTLFFLGKLKVTVIEWILFNSCSPNSFLYLLLFILFLRIRNASCLVITFLPIYFLGTLSMFVMPWHEGTLTAHIGHIIMTINLIWAIYVIVKYKEYKALAIGLLMSILFFAPYVAYVLSYNQTHAEEFLRLFQ